jgi:hypothetical protein
MEKQQLETWIFQYPYIPYVQTHQHEVFLQLLAKPSSRWDFPASPRSLLKRFAMTMAAAPREKFHRQFPILVGWWKWGS